MFVLKKVLALALMPLSIGLAAVWAGVVCWWLNRRPKAAKLLVLGGVLLLTLLSFSGIANWVINPLEMCYPPLVDTAGLGEARWVVVLAGGQTPEEGMPANLQSRFFPRASELGKAESALHEYLGLLWSAVKGAP